MAQAALPRIQPTPTPTRLQGLDQELCRRRNRLQALRFGVNSAPISLAQRITDPPTFSKGRGPKSGREALRMINALLPAGYGPLSEEDVWLVPVMQAANSNFVASRYLSLGTTTLRNVQRESEEGFALMNSHHTGSLSTPSELPFGRTYAGRYERYDRPSGQRFERAMLWTYMLRSVHPNGSQGPSSDDLYRMISGGVVFDVSMGLNGGRPMCDLCGFDVRDGQNCPHVPGTERGMDDAQKRSQRARGISDGLASYTLEDGHAGEVSPVYDGAVPGAGFSKAVSLARTGALSPTVIAQAACAYAALLSEGDLSMPANIHDDANPKSTLAEKMRNFLFSDAPNPVYSGSNTESAAAILFGPDARPPVMSTRPENAEAILFGPDDDDRKEEGDGDAGDAAPAGDDTSADANDTPPPASDRPVAGGQPNDAAPGASPPEMSGGGDYVPFSTLERERAEALKLQARLAAFEQAERTRFAQDTVALLTKDQRLFAAGVPAAVAFVAALQQIEGASPQEIVFTDNLQRTHRLSLVETFRHIFGEVPQHALHTPMKVSELPEGAALLGASDGEESDIVELTAEARRYAQGRGSTGRPAPGTKGRQNGTGRPQKNART